MKKLFLAAVLVTGAIAEDVMTPLEFADYCKNSGGIVVNSLFDNSGSDKTFSACRDQFANVIALNVQSFSITREQRPQAIRAFEKMARDVKAEEAVRVDEMAAIDRMILGAEKAKR